MYMTSRLGYIVHTFFRHSPKRAVVKSFWHGLQQSDLESKCPHVKSLPMLFVR
ncbi:Uncharacterised protein [Yokenella regensburgei]|uniref:Uncharacterized protein n=1 Tax=Yokenella regensburgei TaxID=158877 RepID=A0AB38G1G9_9ENTR|nr:hypothetical protein FHR25_001081 [Yokenella regensburgei]SQA65385.1 Uncharacterised protein [Yokenella regensburgei]SQA95836.1 Uncharacterised protein [Yokenella regensburgei]SUQ03961.1 Uncharacterised protein [Yokenella regensburgei]VFS12382.1 Uncharacterised protein [Yokenella regensburgei]